MSEVVIFGTGDYARYASVYLDQDSPHEVVAFTVDEEYMDAERLLDREVVPFGELLDRHPPDRFEMLVAVGYTRVNKARAEIFGRCKELGYRCVSYVSSRTTQIAEVEVGENTFINAENNLSPFVRIGDDCVLGSGNYIGHDSVIGDHCFLGSQVAVGGKCTIGDYCFLGLNATLRDGLTIAPECVIGAGAMLLSDTERGGVYPGNAARAISRKSWELRGI